MNVLRELFLLTLRLGAHATVMMLAVLPLAALLRRVRAPRFWVLALYGLLALRLVCPLTPQSPVSIFNVPLLEDYANRFADGFRTGYVGDYEVAVDAPGGTQAFERAVEAGVEPVTTEFGWRAVFYTTDEDGTVRPATRGYDAVLPWFAGVWAVGAAALLTFGVANYILLLRRLRFAVKEGDVWLSDRVRTPCVVGFFRPKIVLPFGLEGKQREYVLCHEREHVRRGDLWLKLIAFCLQCVYWHIPWLWGAYSAFLEEIEYACDSQALAGLGEDAKADYSEALVDLSVGRRFPGVLQLSFSEAYLRDRVKQVLRWKRPLRWVALPAFVTCALAACLLLTGAVRAQLPPVGTYGAVYLGGEADGQVSEWQFRITGDGGLYLAEGRSADERLVGELVRQPAENHRYFNGKALSDDIEAADLQETYAAASPQELETLRMILTLSRSFYATRDADDAATLWTLCVLDGGATYLIREQSDPDGAVDVQMLSLMADFYRGADYLPQGEYEAEELLYYGAWYDTIPDADFAGRPLRVNLRENRFTVTAENGTQLWDAQIPIAVESPVYLTDDLPGGRVPALDDGDAAPVLTFPQYTRTYGWRVADSHGNETGWRLYLWGDTLYAGYWRPFGSHDQTRACCCFFTLKPAKEMGGYPTVQAEASLGGNS